MLGVVGLVLNDTGFCGSNVGQKISTEKLET